MASLTQWTRVWVNSRSWWWTGRPGVLQSMVSQTVVHNWATELNWTVKKTEHQELIILNGGISEDSWESIGQQGDPTIHPKGNQSYSLEGLLRIWNSNTLATWCEELTHWKRLWCWEGLKAGGEGDDRGWDGWMASLTRWTWVWVNSGSWWWTRRPGVLLFMGSERVGQEWATELNWTELGQQCYEIIEVNSHK